MFWQDTLLYCSMLRQIQLEMKALYDGRLYTRLKDVVEDMGPLIPES